MNTKQNTVFNNTTEPFPGCLGRMTDHFDSGVSDNKLLTDKPLRQGLPISRSQSDIARMLGPPFGDWDKDKITLSELGRANKIVNGTPMKLLIAQEMKKEIDSKHTTPNVVARLMGIESLPQQWLNSSVPRVHARGHSRRTLSHSDIPSESWQEPAAFWDRGIHEIHPCPEQNYKDVYDVWKQSGKLNHVREKSQQKARYNDNVDESKMAFIHQNFMEAKRLSSDEKLRQSKEFQDALEVLSSNKDSFLKFLQEPNSMFSQSLSELQSIPSPPETTRITVLKPCKVVDNEKLTETKSNNQIKRPPELFQTPVWDIEKSRYSPKHYEHPSQPTRIVVLKPSTVKTHNIEVSPFRSPRMEEFYEEPQDSETQHSRKMAKEITQKIRENLMGDQRDETMPFSASSNGYVGDESSFNKSDNEYAAGTLSDSEVISPTCRHSWDYTNRFGSPHSPSSSRASFSPESSVCREAKKRLSERWAMMASNGNAHDKHVRKGSSTLGEMLALSDGIKLVRPQEHSGSKEEDSQGSTSNITININKESSGNFPKNLSRSKSAPSSSTISGSRFNVEALDPETRKIHASKELIKSKSMTSSLKGKVSSMFFSRKRPSKEKSDTAGKSEGQQGRVERVESPPCYPRMISNAGAQSGNIGLEASKAYEWRLSAGNIPSELIRSGHNCGVVLVESDLSVAQPAVSGSLSWNQEQPSPISVLEPPFEEEDKIRESSGAIKPDHLGSGSLTQHLNSNLIDKSPPIGTIARTLTWEDSGTEAVTSYPLKAFGSVELEETEDWLFLVRRLLSLAGLDGVVKGDYFFSRWHSPESPLDPSLRDINANLNDQESLYNVKQRRGRSNWKLVFDSVNDVLVEITGYKARDWAHDRLLEGESTMLVDRVSAQMKDCFTSDVNYVPEDGGDSNSLLVENMVKKEVVGVGWVDNWRSEKDIFSKEIQVKLLEELVEEAVVGLTSR